ncbi:uncharacterized protein LOC132638367 [Lycium barbarum]|uniref:uncharacterized protein LOC132638367 n=1 Tax=Lycium barbarum TaxID=112863 RepID=UPI00293EE196|nr:uncharacterized protein LOC132638367 [Lycium barbarum]
MVDVAAINLEDLYIYSPRDLNVVKLTACKTLKSLFLNGVTVTEIWLEKLFSSLQNLEKFYLIRCLTLRTVKISSYRLKKLIVVDCLNLVNAQVSAPNVLYFSYNCCSSLPTLNLKGSGSLEATISFDSLETLDSDWYSKLTSFLRNFNHSIAIELSSQNDEVIVIPKDVRVNLLPPLHATNNLQVNIQE